MFYLECSGIRKQPHVSVCAQNNNVCKNKSKFIKQILGSDFPVIKKILLSTIYMIFKKSKEKQNSMKKSNKTLKKEKICFKFLTKNYTQNMHLYEKLNLILIFSMP